MYLTPIRRTLTHEDHGAVRVWKSGRAHTLQYEEPSKLVPPADIQAHRRQFRRGLPRQESVSRN